MSKFKRPDNDIFGRKPLPQVHTQPSKRSQDNDIFNQTPLPQKPYVFLQNHKHNDIFGGQPKFEKFQANPYDVVGMTPAGGKAKAGSRFAQTNVFPQKPTEQTQVQQEPRNPDTYSKSFQNVYGGVNHPNYVDNKQKENQREIRIQPGSVTQWCLG